MLRIRYAWHCMAQRANGGFLIMKAKFLILLTCSLLSSKIFSATELESACRSNLNSAKVKYFDALGSNYQNFYEQVEEGDYLQAYRFLIKNLPTDPELFANRFHAPYLYQHTVKGPVLAKGLMLMVLHDTAKLLGLEFDETSPTELINSLKKFFAKKYERPLVKLSFDFFKDRSFRKRDFTNNKTVFASLGLCSFAPFPRKMGCVPTLYRTLKKSVGHIKVGRYSKTTYFFSNILNKYLQSEKAYQGTLKLALRMLSHIEKSIHLKTYDYSKNVFDDLDMAFSDLGLSEKEKIQLKNYTALFYSTRGSSFNMILFQKEFPKNYAPLIAAQSVFAQTINYLDHMVKKNGRYYSLPKGVKSSCIYPKPYHTIAAQAISYIATEDRPLRRYFAPISSYMLGLGYSLYGHNILRKPLDADYQQARSIKNDNHRIDLLFNATGANYKNISLRSKGDELNLDKTFEKLTTFSKPSNSSEASLKNWLKLIQPFKAFKLIQ